MIAISEEALAVIERSTKATLLLVESLRNAQKDDDEWTILFPATERCKISGLSKSTIYKHKDIRKKMVAGRCFYAAADVRKMFKEEAQ